MGASEPESIPESGGEANGDPEAERVPVAPKSVPEGGGNQKRRNPRRRERTEENPRPEHPNNDNGPNRTGPRTRKPVDPTAIALFRMGVHSFRSKEYDNAIKRFTRSIAIESQYADALAFRGITWLAKGSHEQALVDCTKAVDIDPQQIVALNVRAWIFATSPISRIRNGQLALVDALRACKLSNWSDHKYIGTLAAAYAEAGDFDSAVKLIDKAMAMDSHFAADLRRRMRARFKTGKPYRSAQTP